MEEEEEEDDEEDDDVQYEEGGPVKPALLMELTREINRNGWKGLREISDWMKQNTP